MESKLAAEAEVNPKVSLSSSSGSSFPIRAPPTVDSDYETSVSTNGEEICDSSYSSGGSESEFESEEFVSGEDEFESASDSERTFLADPNDETLEGSHVVKEHLVYRPSAGDPYGQIREKSSRVEEYVVSRSLVPEIDDETFGTTLEDVGEYESESFGRAAVVRIGISAGQKPGVPIAKVSRDSDDDSVGTEDVEDDEFWGSARVPGISIPASGVKVFDVGEDENDKSEFGPALEAEVGENSEVESDGADPSEGHIVVDSVNDSVLAEVIRDTGPDDAEEAIEESFISDRDDFLQEKSEVNEDVLRSEGENRGLENMEGERILGENRADLGDRNTLRIDTTAQMDEGFDLEEEKKVLEASQIASSDIDQAGIDETKGTVMGQFVTDDGKIDRKKYSRITEVEVLEGSGALLLGPDLTDYANHETIDSRLLEVDATATDEVEQSLPFATILAKMEEPEVDMAEESRNINSSKTTEGNVMEDGLNGKCNTLGSLLPVSNDVPEVKSEMEDGANCDSDRLKDSPVTEDDFKDFIFGVSDATKQVMDDIEQNLTIRSLGDSSRNLLIEEPMLGSLDKEVITYGESEGKDLFGSTVFATLLKAATGAGLGGGSFTVSSSNASSVFSLEHAEDSITSDNSLKPNHHSPFALSELMVGTRDESEGNLSEEEKKKLEKLQHIRVKFLRLVQRLGQSLEDSMVAQVLYRLVLAAGGASSQTFSLESAKRTAMQLEAEGKDDLAFSLNILVLGKSGVGKSATINSIFGEKKAVIDAFEPATAAVKDFVGTVDGVKFRIFDTPGLRSSLTEQAFNRKVLLSLRKLMKKFPPDIVLYVDRLDTQTRDLNDLPLLRSITSFLGASIWQMAIVTLTHAASSPPDGPSGTPLSFDLFVAQKSRAIQQLINQSVGGLRVMNHVFAGPVSLVENHPSSWERVDEQLPLPNGESWRPQLLLLCYSLKILSEANSVVKTPDLFDHRNLFGFGFRARPPPLPFFLSSLLQTNKHPKLPAESGADDIDSDTELSDLSDSGQEIEDEYDQLPPFKPLKRSQIAKLSKEQKKAYFDEYDYRVKLLQKKVWIDELKRLRELKKRGVDGASNFSYTEEDGDDGAGSPAAVAVPLPDMVLSPSFDGDYPTYRYRFLEPTSQLLTRPVLDVHGWDHDCGYDGVSLESAHAIAGSLPAAFEVQITKDKKEFNIHLGSSIAAKHGENGSTMAALDIQTVGKQLAYVLKGETKMKSHKRNKIASGVSVTLLGENVATGLKLEDRIAVGERLVLLGSTGAIRSQGDTAYGANLELRLRENDFPIGEDQIALILSLMRWRGDLVWGCNLQSQFSVGRSSKMVVRAGLDRKLSGQVSVRMSSSEQLQIALLGILPIANAILRRICPWLSQKYPACL
ncbi:translocase of chloroplast 159, chloroplastic [Diospyros lotus]|uniref:translocase of chloroplast 159, chloroplastic n=1 Tax=Diospyros lotus TaxID=55363 RepID=UPI002251764C|nr:translocase of chloroplast 159, chloroplastic [Diospyros lotus]